MSDWSSDEFQRQWFAPKPGDPYYICLSDLRIAIQRLIPPQRSRVLDYGCGGSPYRSLFEGSIYHRADLAGGENLDFEYRADSRLPSEAFAYDCVLSTQVLEHVEDPAVYLEECYRVLKPGGHLLLTTHGIFEDHACPHDYWRWTSLGLRQMLEKTGFKVHDSYKLTTGPRGVVFLIERELARLNFKRAGAYDYLLWFGFRIIRMLGVRRLHKASDKSFPQHRVVDASEAGHNIYICVAMLAAR
jgi:SAM-dependent methyltransferase